MLLLFNLDIKQTQIHNILFIMIVNIAITNVLQYDLWKLFDPYTCLYVCLPVSLSICLVYWIVNSCDQFLIIGYLIVNVYLASLK